MQTCILHHTHLSFMRTSGAFRAPTRLVQSSEACTRTPRFSSWRTSPRRTRKLRRGVLLHFHSSISSANRGRKTLCRNILIVASGQYALWVSSLAVAPVSSRLYSAIMVMVNACEVRGGEEEMAYRLTNRRQTCRVPRPYRCCFRFSREQPVTYVSILPHRR